MGLISTVALAFSGVGCDPGHAVAFEKETNEFIEGYCNGSFILSLEPIQKKKLEEIEFSSVTYGARDSMGRVLYR